MRIHVLCSFNANSFVYRLDLEMPGPAVVRKPELIEEAIAKGTLDTETLDKRVEAVLTLLVRAGKFQNPEIPAERAVDSPEHSALIRQAGAESIVLLKNSNNILPLKREKLTSIAMLGLSKRCLAHGGGSAAVNAHHRVTPWDAFEATLDGKVELKYAEGWLHIGDSILIKSFANATMNRGKNHAKPAVDGG